jgi:hypothetical protein
LRLPHTPEGETVAFVNKTYWSGAIVEGHELQSLGHPWSEPPIIEVLYLGKIEFYDRDLGL